MDQAALRGVIEAAFEVPDQVGPHTAGEIRDAVEAALDGLDSGELRVAEKAAGRLAGPPMAQEGGAAVVPPQRHGGDRAAAPSAARPGGTRCRRNSPAGASNRFRDAGFRAVPGCDRAPLGLYRAGRRADAELRQCRRLCRQRHDGRYLGDGRLLRADRQELPPLGRGRHRRRAGAAAGRAGHHRGRLLYRRAQRGRRGRHRRAGRGAGDGHLHRRHAPRSSTAPPARSYRAACRPIRWSCRARCPASRCPTAAPARASIARSSSSASTRRPAPRPRSTSCCATDARPLDPVGLAARADPRGRASPRRTRARSTSSRRRSSALGFACHRAVFEGDGSDPIANLYARARAGRPQLLLRRPYRRRAAGRPRPLVVRSVRRRGCATARCAAAAPST